MAKSAKQIKSKKVRPAKIERTAVAEAVIVEVENTALTRAEFEVRPDPWSKIEPEAMLRTRRSCFSAISKRPRSLPRNG